MRMRQKRKIWSAAAERQRSGVDPNDQRGTTKNLHRQTVAWSQDPDYCSLYECLYCFTMRNRLEKEELIRGRRTLFFWTLDTTYPLETLLASLPSCHDVMDGWRRQLHLDAYRIRYYRYIGGCTPSWTVRRSGPLSWTITSTLLLIFHPTDECKMQTHCHH